MFTVAIRLSDERAPKGKLADADLVFNNQTDLDGLILTGFSVWDARQPGQRNVTFPARSYTVNGDRRSFALLREGSNPVEGQKARKWLTDLIVASYDEAIIAQGNKPPTPAPAPRPAVAQTPPAAQPARSRR